jgi:hypothetical protein
MSAWGFRLARGVPVTATVTLVDKSKIVMTGALALEESKSTNTLLL